MTNVPKLPDAPRAKVERPIRDAAYALRLKTSCDRHPRCPEMNYGRLRWLQVEIKKEGLSVSKESVSRWMLGEVKPRREKNKIIAEILGVEEHWLDTGTDFGNVARERHLSNAMIDGVVNVIAGFIQMDGGSPAFPDDSDARAQEDNIDLYAVIRGAKYSFNISLAVPVLTGGWSFAVPSNYREHIIILGAVRDGFGIDIVEITAKMMTKPAKLNGGVVVVLSSADVENAKIESFTRRL